MAGWKVISTLNQTALAGKTGRKRGKERGTINKKEKKIEDDEDEEPIRKFGLCKPLLMDFLQCGSRDEKKGGRRRILH